MRLRHADEPGPDTRDDGEPRTVQLAPTGGRVMTWHGRRCFVPAEVGQDPPTASPDDDRTYLATTPAIGQQALAWSDDQIRDYFSDRERARAAFVRGYLADQDRRSSSPAAGAAPAKAEQFFSEFLGR